MHSECQIKNFGVHFIFYFSSFSLAIQKTIYTFAAYFKNKYEQFTKYILVVALTNCPVRELSLRMY